MLLHGAGGGGGAAAGGGGGAAAGGGGGAGAGAGGGGGGGDVRGVGWPAIITFSSFSFVFFQHFTRKDRPVHPFSKWQPPQQKQVKTRPNLGGVGGFYRRWVSK